MVKWEGLVGGCCVFNIYSDMLDEVFEWELEVFGLGFNFVFY